MVHKSNKSISFHRLHKRITCKEYTHFTFFWNYYNAIIKRPVLLLFVVVVDSELSIVYKLQQVFVLWDLVNVCLNSLMSAVDLSDHMIELLKMICNLYFVSEIIWNIYMTYEYSCHINYTLNMTMNQMFGSLQHFRYRTFRPRYRCLLCLH